MRRSAVLAMMIVGCGDDLSLRVSVEHPPNAAIERTVVTIYEPPSTDVSCASIEFQDVTETVLAGMEVARIEETANGTVGSLDGISRVGTKLVVARGFRANGMYFAAGCTEHGTIGGNDTVVVKTQVVAAVSLGGVQADGTDIPSIPITITTPLGSALPRRPISWRVYGYAGAMPVSSAVALQVGADEWQPATPTCTGQDGTILLRPVPPSQIGGYASRVRVSWGEEAPRQFSSFTRVELVRRDLAALASAAPAGRLCTTRASGATKRVVCIEDSDPGAAVDPIARDLSVTVANGAATLAIAGSQNFAATEAIASVYSLQAGANRDAYAITTLGRVIGLFSPSRGPNAVQGSFASDGTVEEAMVIPSCQANDPPRLIVRTRGATSQNLWIMDPLGGPHLAFGNGFGTDNTLKLRLNTAGCVTELQTDSTMPQRRQVVVVDAELGANVGATLAVYDCSTGRCSTRLPSAFSGVGFKRGTDSDEDRLVASSFDTTGTIVSEMIFLDAKIVERARIASAAVPDRIVSGNFDGDGKTDLIWNFAGNLGQTNFQVAYARDVEGAPLTALTGPKLVSVDDLFTAEVTGDGFDDIVIVSRSRDGIATSGVSVIPTRAVAGPINVVPDDPCR